MYVLYFRRKLQLLKLFFWIYAILLPQNKTKICHCGGNANLYREFVSLLFLTKCTLASENYDFTLHWLFLLTKCLDQQISQTTNFWKNGTTICHFWSLILHNFFVEVKLTKSWTIDKFKQANSGYPNILGKTYILLRLIRIISSAELN